MRETALQRQLATVRLRWIARDAVRSTARVVASIGPACFTAGWLDYRIEFSHGMRALELCALVASIIWVTRRWVAPAWRERRDAYTAALLVEAVDPRFGGRLVSRVEFSEKDGRPAGQQRGGSPELIAAMCERVDRQARDVEFSKAVDVQCVWRPVFLAIITLLAAGTLVAAQPEITMLWLKRTLWPLGAAEWPRRTLMSGLQAEYWVRRGDSVTVTGKVSGEVPRSGDIEWRARPVSAGPQPAGPRRTATRSGGSSTFDVQPDGSFQVKVGPLLESIELAIELGDASADGVHVNVVTPPQLASVEAVYHYPDFTGRKPDRVQSGDVRVLVGTRVELEFTADRPVQRADISFQWQQASGSGGTEASTTRPAVGHVELKSPLQGATSFVVRNRGQYQIGLYDAHGFTSDAPATFVIDPADNELPVVAIRRPDTEHTATPATRLILVFDASDDHGVTEAAVCWRKREKAQTPSALPIEQQPIAIAAPRRSWNVRYRWDLATLGLQTGDEVEYYVQAGDAGEHLTTDKVGRSTVHVLKIVDSETLRQWLESDLKQILGEMDAVAQQQAAGMDAVSMAILSLPTAAQQPAAPEMGRIQSESNRQLNILRQMERLADRLGRLADDLDESFLADGARVQDLKNLAKGLADLTGLPMQRVLQELEVAQSSLAENIAAKPSEER